MAENHALSKGYAAGFVKPNPARDLAAFDLLPQAVRRALDDAPFAISAVAALKACHAGGVAHALREVEASAEAWLAACEKETGVPRPVVPLQAARSKEASPDAAHNAQRP
jgi:hypothetical protein